ncbi:MAG: hypothetical protein HY558_03065 [Euryarchaeota archaeon]|nr:hypothetical protein [Euryarchaeota archaeon]
MKEAKKSPANLTWVFLSIALVAVLAPVQAGSDPELAGAGGNPLAPCGDMVCDAAERADPNLCPRDCGGASSPSLPSPTGNATPGGPGFPVVEQRHIRPEFQTLGLTGMGVAVSPGSPSDFHVVRVGVATVNVMVFDEAQQVTVGVLIFEDSRYSLKDVSLGSGRISATIYQKDKMVGALELASRRKGGLEVWAGDITVNGARMNAYILQPPRPPTPDESGADARRYCETNPSACKGVAPTGCDPAQPGCRAEIGQYCATHPKEIRCIALQRGFCANNTNDVRCRNTEIPADIAPRLDAFCKQKPDLCSGLGTTREEILRNCSSPNAPKRCDALIRDYCTANPDPNDPACADSRGEGRGPPPPPGAPGQGFGPPGQGPGGPGQGPGAPGEGRGPPGPGPGNPGQRGPGPSSPPPGLENRTDRLP